MDRQIPDITLIRTLFSRAIAARFGFHDEKSRRDPYIQLDFESPALRMAQAAFEQIVRNIGKDFLRLTIHENSGDYLVLAFAWEKYKAGFSASPDEYSRDRYRIFARRVSYHEHLRLYFNIITEEADRIISADTENGPADAIPLIYYERIP
ncbi:MAG: hypothetical protein QM755_01815 [Luteolibacter sp.]